MLTHTAIVLSPSFKCLPPPLCASYGCIHDANIYYVIDNNLFQSRLSHTGCEDGEIACPLGRIGRSGRIDTFGGRCINESFVCDGIQDCVGGTDEVNCGLGKTFISYASNDCYIWKDVGNVNYVFQSH